MSKNLVIVESPAKAKTVSGYLGPDYTVMASFGHVRDLPKKGMSIDIEHDFTPEYEVTADKKKVIAELRKAVKNAETVWLASDPDREGEAIAWHLAAALKLDPKTTKRIVFHEITKPGIAKAVANAGVIDQGLVDAQQARRILDRLVGYELSPILWKKVQPGLSAGRVQSVAVRLIVEREREIEGFEGSSNYRVLGWFAVPGGLLKAELATRFPSVEEAEAFAIALKDATFSVEDLTSKPATRKPSAPFTTSTLQQEASRKLSFGVRQTMSVAQRLYEQGLISYMRTDSVNLSQTALADAAQAITKQHGANYHHLRTYTTKSKGAQEAHEAIRPTDFSRTTGGEDGQQKRLYELIYKRALASQMADAKLTRSGVVIAPSNRDERFKASAESIDFDGFLKLYEETSDDETEADTTPVLPPLTVGQALDLNRLTATQTFERPKPRYTEASLVKKLEEMGIGRPSTYAPTIATVQDRGYVEKGDLEGTERSLQVVELTGGEVSRTTITERTGSDKGKLLPTPVARLVNDFLVKYVSEVVDYNFTADVENQFDAIEEGKESWQKMIGRFYKPFHETVVAAEGISRQEASQARELGKDPKSGRPVIARLGRYGPMLQIGLAEDEEKPTFAPLPPGTAIESVTMEQALGLIALPRLVGKTTDGQDMLANFGRFGPYIKFGSLYVSIKPDDPFTITEDRARQLVAEKLEAEANKYIQRWEKEGIDVVNGRYGPYITDGKKNAKIPKDMEASDVTLELAKELIEKAPVRKGKKVVRKRKK